MLRRSVVGRVGRVWAFGAKQTMASIPKLPEEMEAERNLEAGRTKEALSNLKQALEIVHRFDIPSSDPFPQRLFSSIVPILELHADTGSISHILGHEKQSWIDAGQRSLLQRLAIESRLHRGEWHSALEDLRNQASTSRSFPDILKQFLAVDCLIMKMEREGGIENVEEVERLLEALSVHQDLSQIPETDETLSGTSLDRLRVTRSEVIERRGRLMMIKKENEKALGSFLEALRVLGMEDVLLERLDTSKALEGRKDDHYPLSSLRLIQAGILTGKSLIELNELNRAEEILSASLSWSEKRGLNDQSKSIDIPTLRAEISAVHSLTGLGRCLMKRKVSVYAEGILRNALEKTDRVVSLDPAIKARMHHETFSTKVLYADVLRSMGRERKADEILRSLDQQESTE